tara:strand:+ start:30 stop:725 length:696 start_codon:yes stop_codon:yes gene_type:complete
MLKVENLNCGYGGSTVLRGLSFEIKEGEVLSLIGPNGAGKTSGLLCLMGLVNCHEGSVFFKDKNITSLPSEKRILEGLAIVPEGRRIFPNLTVFENLMAGGHILSNEQCEKGILKSYEYFPILKERKHQKAGLLSGGEQQMLAVSRGLMVNPQVLLVDEISLGLMPKMVDECYRVLKKLKDDGLSIILVEQNTEKALEFGDQVIMLEAGQIVWEGDSVTATRENIAQKIFT